jgi:hypothetical protein
MKNKKFFYRLICRGKVEKTYQKTKRHKLRKKIWNVPHYSKLKYVIAPCEDTARAMMYDMLTDYKWTGYRLVHIQQ